MQIATLDQPHIHVETAVDFAVVVNRNHVRGVQPCRGVGFAAESTLKVLVVREVRGHDFDRHDPVGVSVMRAKAKHLPANPADGVELPRKHDGEQRYLSHEQLHRLAVASGRFRILVLVLGYCELRLGEATALRVGDVNLTARRIRVSRSATYVTAQGLVEGATKNHTARTVPVPKFLAPLLETEIREHGDTELLFGSGRGGYLTVGQVRWAFDTAAKAVGLDGLTLHELRHTCASLAITAGANVKVLQTLLGHKTATLTLDRYGHLFPDDLGRIADAFDDAAETAAARLRHVAPLRALPADQNSVEL